MTEDTLQVTRRTAGLLLIAGCASTSGAPRRLALRAADGAPVRADSYGQGADVVVLVPGGHGQGATWEPQARGLAQAGFHVVAMDHRGFGADAQNVHQDVLGVVRSLRAGGARKVSVVGASWGGWAAATAAIMQPGLIDRLVLLAHSPYENPQNLGGRKLFIVASDDPGSDGAPRLAIIRRQFDLSPEPKALVVLDGAAHAQRLFDTAEGSRLFSEILLFLKAP